LRSSFQQLIIPDCALCDESIEIVAVGLRPDSAKTPVIMSHTVTFQNSEEAAIASLKLVDETHPPGAITESMARVTSPEQEYADQAGANPEGYRYTSENAYINDNADVAEILRKAFTTLPGNSRTFSLWYSMDPCSRRDLPDMASQITTLRYTLFGKMRKTTRDAEAGSGM
jgi:hypothetical protein